MAVDFVVGALSETVKLSVDYPPIFYNVECEMVREELASLDGFRFVQKLMEKLELPIPRLEGCIDIFIANRRHARAHLQAITHANLKLQLENLESIQDGGVSVWDLPVWQLEIRETDLGLLTCII